MKMDGCGVVDHEGIGADFLKKLGFSDRVQKLVCHSVVEELNKHLKSIVVSRFAIMYPPSDICAQRMQSIIPLSARPPRPPFDFKEVRCLKPSAQRSLQTPTTKTWC